MPNSTYLDIEEQRALGAELLPGESLLWTGRPAPGILFHASDAFLIPFSFFWGGFSLLWESGVSGVGLWAERSPSLFTMLWGIPFVLLGQYLIWGRFVYSAWKKRRIVYALTNTRALIFVRPPRQKIISRTLAAVPGFTKEIRSDGYGTLRFGPTLSAYTQNRKGNWSAWDSLSLNEAAPAFVDIADVAHVASIAQTSQLAQKFSESPV